MSGRRSHPQGTDLVTAKVLTPDDDIARCEDLPTQHIFPMSGRAHVTDGGPCWCAPRRDPVEDDLGDVCGTVIVHNREHTDPVFLGEWQPEVAQ